MSKEKRRLDPRIRFEVLTRDKFKCRKCGLWIKEILEIHHIEPYAKVREDKVDNLITLCFSCHRIAPIDKEEFYQWLNSLRIQNYKPYLNESVVDIIFIESRTSYWKMVFQAYKHFQNSRRNINKLSEDIIKQWIKRN